MSSNWSELPSELLQVISPRVYSASILDYVRAAAVCKPWRSVFKRKPTHTLPLIMLRSLPGLVEYSHLCFNSIEGNVFHRFGHPNIPFLYSCCGSGHGWLVMTDERDDHVCYKSNDDLNIYREYNEEILLYNPITRKKISLPCLKTLRKNDGVCVVEKAVISSQPTLENNENNCVIAAIVYYPNFNDLQTENNYNFIIFCKPGDTKWIILNEAGRGNNCLSDLAYCNGSLYALDRCSGLVVCDIGSSTPMVRRYVSAIQAFDGHYGKVNIIESGGELLLFKWYLNYYCDFLKFRVLRLELDSYVWSEVKSLGGRSLFITCSQCLNLKSSVSILASDHPGLKQNCIYFMNCYRGNRCGIFSLEDGSIEYFLPNLGCPSFYAFWITPSW